MAKSAAGRNISIHIPGCHQLQSSCSPADYHEAAYVVLGVNVVGQKEMLGIWVDAEESIKCCLSILNELKSRGVKNIFLFCVDAYWL